MLEIGEEENRWHGAEMSTNVQPVDAGRVLALVHLFLPGHA